jgi:hypothetical protein
MGICQLCEQEMTTADSCTGDTLTIDQREYARIRFGSESQWEDFMIDQGERCPDCGVPVGGFHHLNCDVEEFVPEQVSVDPFS